MESRNLRVFVMVAVALGAVVLIAATELRLPGNHRGYEPVQPIAFSHRLHSGELKLDCQYCHFGAERSRHAGLPPATMCMNCHRVVTAAWDLVLAEEAAAKAAGRAPATLFSPELKKLYRALALDDHLKPDPSLAPQPIEWVRVHHLPDFVYFDHRPHVARGLACETCHGPVQSMERVRQESDLSMGWCVNCHRSYPALPSAPSAEHVSTDCSSCHF
ncbi:MAG: cytochrome c3 family protein [Planctomycetota bacterium]